MSIPIPALEVGKCSLTNSGQVWKIIQHMPDGRVQYQHRGQNVFVGDQKPVPVAFDSMRAALAEVGHT